MKFKTQLVEKKIKYKTNPNFWYSLHRAREIVMFEKQKIITPEISLGCNMTIDSNFLYHNTKVYTIELKENVSQNITFYLALLNSKIMWFFLSNYKKKRYWQNIIIAKKNKLFLMYIN